MNWILFFHQAWHEVLNHHFGVSCLTLRKVILKFKKIIVQEHELVNCCYKAPAIVPSPLFIHWLPYSFYILKFATNKMIWRSEVVMEMNEFCLKNQFIAKRSGCCNFLEGWRMWTEPPWNALEELRGDEMTKLIAEWSVAGTLINEDPRRDCSWNKHE